MLGCSVTSVKNVELLLLYIAPFSYKAPPFYSNKLHSDLNCISFSESSLKMHTAKQQPHQKKLL
ncbi:hypothetical protein [uncultured Gammaproteobacteria bacterium]|nr:hypothetical protein [uncultured Gammaproteobacteria bacterium]SHN93431.1 hypothetical protein BCLUESOX_635 [bacterium endosymbiont of Bathymodiolus sp. 5 South]CAC9639764.1 hypothetical protein [uncultured Gammaproteobacteria bacterium]CAC9646693.1 hypothetical protein [uncultured Gammaproteobacteria bacterium]VVH59404.1 hypothetical protein BSPCLSOX_2244 [uncultured Gammaproteobacteria bacterium]